MGAPLGHKKAGGRAPGTPNKATGMARTAIAEFVDANADRLVEWLDRIAEESPKDAFSAFMSVVEYHIPKLARTEQQQLDKDGNKADPVPVRVEFVQVDANPRS